MRKKLFAVIMSAMMMITFMPAMAFAALDGPTEVKEGFYVSPFTSAITTAAESFTYDGAEHEVTYVLPASTTVVGRTTTYSGVGTVGGKAWTYAASATAPKVKDAGTYYITATVKSSALVKKYYAKAIPTGERYLRIDGHNYSLGQEIKDTDEGGTQDSRIAYMEKNWDSYGGDTAKAFKNFVNRVEVPGTAAVEKTETLALTVNQRPVVINAKGANTLLKKQVYNGKGITFSDADLNVTPLWNTKTSAYDKANTGLVQGESLFAQTAVTPAEVGVYWFNDFFKSANMNANYRLAVEADDAANWAKNKSTSFNGLFVEITKATPVVKITSNEFVIKSGKSAKVKYTTNLGTAKLTKTSGNAKITLSNGKLKVKKGLKKGTYKVTVKAAVAESNNWNAAKRVKKLTVVVK